MKSQNQTIGSSLRRALATAVAITVAAVLGFGSMSVATAADTITDDNVAARVASATTAADHEAIAAYYRTQAAEAGEKAKYHEQMLDALKKARGKASWPWKDHCNNLIKTYKRLQNEAEEMAKAQDQLAKKSAE